jgi:hypothetical protein
LVTSVLYFSWSSLAMRTSFLGATSSNAFAMADRSSDRSTD